MKRFLIVFIALGLFVSCKPKPSSLDEKVVYMMGAQIGFDLGRQKLSLNMSSFESGLSDSVAGNATPDQAKFQQARIKYMQSKNSTDQAEFSKQLGVLVGSQLKTQVDAGLKLNNSFVIAGIEAGSKAEELETVLSKEDREQANKRMQELQQKIIGPEKEKGQKFLEENAKKPGIKTTLSGLQYKVIKPGSGPKPKATSHVTVHYKGTLLDGTEFDSSYKRNQPSSFGLGQVIKGWTEGLQLMRKGAKYIFYIKSDLGYGDRGSSGIPGGALLTFEVELISFKL